MHDLSCVFECGLPRAVCVGSAISVCVQRNACLRLCVLVCVMVLTVSIRVQVSVVHADVCLVWVCVCMNPRRSKASHGSVCLLRKVIGVHAGGGNWCVTACDFCEGLRVRLLARYHGMVSLRAYLCLCVKTHIRKMRLSCVRMYICITMCICWMRTMRTLCGMPLHHIIVNRMLSSIY